MPTPKSSSAAGSAPLLHSNDSDRSSVLSSAASSFNDDDSASFETRQRRRSAAALTRRVSFVSALLSALCAGSVTVFSLYGHIFQERLRYTQFQVNGVAIAASVSMYLPVSFFGYFCDRAGPAPLSFAAAFLFGGGYGLAAGLYRKAATDIAAGLGKGAVSGGWSYTSMIIAFILVGAGTSAMYLSAVATCAKNFGKGKHRGLALAVPIAAFGLSGMWQSQVGSRILYERRLDGSKGDVDVFRFFLFLAILLFVVGILGTFMLRIVDEQDLIDGAVEEMERSGLLDSSILTPGRTERGYGAIERSNPFDEVEDREVLESSQDLDNLKKTWVLNAETRHFLTDHTMWLLAVGFLFMVGPGEAFINNLGTVIKTLYPPTMNSTGTPTSAATHVSIVGITSTVARLLTGFLTDILAPSPQSQHVQISSSSPILSHLRVSVSRVTFLLAFAVLLSVGLATLASGFVQNHGERFWIVSGLVGAGYGAVFSLTPIIITVIWGVENVGTNWGIVAMFPALGSTLWGLVYSAVYQAVARSPAPPGDRGSAVDGGGGGGGRGDEDADMFCYGARCYSSTFWAMTLSVWIACGLILWAWKGKNGWSRRGIVV